MQLTWPWVSRAEHERRVYEMQATIDAQCLAVARAEGEVRGERARFDDLLKKYHALRLKGANPEPSKPAPIAPKPNLTPVDYAIENRVARANPLQRPALERHLRQYVASQKQLEGYDEDAVCSAITNGHEAAD